MYIVDIYVIGLMGRGVNRSDMDGQWSYCIRICYNFLDTDTYQKSYGYKYKYEYISDIK
jgi:hypothetical protein